MQALSGNITTVFKNFKQETSSFVEKTIRMQTDIKNFENLLDETRAQQMNELLEHRKRSEEMRVETEAVIESMKYTNSKVQTQFRNHLHHFTELQKSSGSQMARIDEIEKELADYPKLRETFWKTELYLQKALPTQMLELVARALQASLENASLK